MGTLLGPWARGCAKFLIIMIAFSPHNSAFRRPLLFPFYRWGNRRAKLPRNGFKPAAFPTWAVSNWLQTLPLLSFPTSDPEPKTTFPVGVDG